MIREGTLKKKTKYTKIKDKRNLWRIRRPPIERLWLFHLDNLLLIQSIRGYQKLSFLESTPTFEILDIVWGQHLLLCHLYLQTLQL